MANYIAKYATKAVTAPGLPATRLHHQAEVEALRCPPHYKQLIATVWQLGGHRRGARCRQWAHMLGYGGHFLTNPAATPSPSASSAAPAPTTAAPSATPAANAIPGTAAR